MNVALNASHFSGYPTDHILGILTDEDAVQRLAAELDRLGVPPEAVKGFVGPRGAEQFGGEHQGVRGWLQEVSRTIAGTSEGRATYLDALGTGQVVVAVDLHGRAEDKQAVAAAFRATGARDINLFGPLMVETLT